MRARAAAVLLSVVMAIPAIAPAAEAAIVLSDLTGLRPAARESAKPHTLLWQGEALEVRGERLGYLQVWDHRIERGGFVSAQSVQRVSLESGNAAELLAVVRFLRDATGREALGIAYAAAYLRAAAPDAVRGPEGAEALELLGTFADRLARRASSGAIASQAAQSALGGHLEVATYYGIGFRTYERDGRVLTCYDGDAFQRVLARGAGADEGQRARSALALTRPECSPGDTQPLERRALEEQRVAILESVKVQPLPADLRNRIHMRRAVLWNTLAFRKARRGEPAHEEAGRALDELSRVAREELTDDDRRSFADAAMRVNASRWAVAPATPSARGPRVLTVARAGGETCVLLVDDKRGESNPLAKRCTYALVWTASAKLNREGNALALAVQHTESWREMWVFRKARDGWTVAALPPAAMAPAVGYAEFAGWVPGGKQVLVARESSGEGKYRRTYEILRVDTLATLGQAGDPSQLPAFLRWQDPSWLQASVR